MATFSFLMDTIQKPDESIRTVKIHQNTGNYIYSVKKKSGGGPPDPPVGDIVSMSMDSDK